IEDIIANPNLKNTDRIVWSGVRSTDFVETDFSNTTNSDVEATGDLVKIWKIWDNRRKEKHIFLHPQNLTLSTTKFTRLPLFGLRFHPLRKGWLPLPPVFNWKSPQDEYNDAREQARNHRKRFIRKFLYAASAFVSEEEIDKLLNGGDGSFAACSDINSVQGAVKPVDNADLGVASSQGMAVSKDDFNTVSATPSERQGGGEGNRTTATQANIVNQWATVRDSRARIQVAKWLSDIGEEILLTAEEKLTAPI